MIYDAEDAPDPDQLRLAAETFARAGTEVGCLQARLSIDNAPARGRKGFFAGGFAVEYAALFDVVNPGLVALGLPIPLGGTSNHFRTAALRRVGGWDAWNVTEDADMGLRLAAFGLEIRDLNSTTWEEAPERPGQWFGQRARWMKGYLQTLLVHTRAPAASVRRIGRARMLCAWLLVGGTVGAALCYPASLVLVAGLLLALVDASAAPDFAPTSVWDIVFATTALSTCLASFAIGIALAIAGVRERRRRDLLARIPALPLYWLCVSLGAWRGLWDLLRRPHHWHKTTHGVARRRMPAAPIGGSHGAIRDEPTGTPAE